MIHSLKLKCFPTQAKNSSVGSYYALKVLQKRENNSKRLCRPMGNMIELTKVPFTYAFLVAYYITSLYIDPVSSLEHRIVGQKPPSIRVFPCDPLPGEAHHVAGGFPQCKQTREGEDAIPDSFCNPI